MFDQILEKAGLKYEDLNASERETLNIWVEALQKGQLSIEKIRDYIASMREAVEKELCQHNLDSKQDLFLKARLRNYLLLEAFLSTPEKAKERMEGALSGVIAKRS